MNAFIKGLSDLWMRPVIPKNIKENFIELNPSALRFIEESLIHNYFSRWPSDYLETEAGQRDLEDHLTGSIEQNRSRFIPWLFAFINLKGAKILEIGCGTGCSTIALAEQKAVVTAIDIDGGALLSARDRLNQYHLQATLLNMNSTELGDRFSKGEFDVIIFFASLEHMLYEERITSIKEAWNLIPQGGLFCVVETPNRLWYIDYHTSGLPFFEWLPDEMALRYSVRSRRQDFREALAKDQNGPTLLRWGRGVSYHEFECGIGAIDQLTVISSLFDYYRKKNLLKRAKWFFSAERKYSRFLKKINPDVPSSFFEKSLDFLIRKNG